MSVVLSLGADDQWYWTTGSGHVFLVQQVLCHEFPLDLDTEPDDLYVVKVDGMRCRDNGELSRMPMQGWAVHWVDVPEYIREAARETRRHEARRLWRLWVHRPSQPRN